MVRIREHRDGRTVPLLAGVALLLLVSWALGASQGVAQSPPSHMVGSLERAAQARYPGMAMFSVVRWGSKDFALTRTARGPYTYAVWERIDGRWSFIFDYRDPVSGSRSDWNRRVNGLYARERFSTSMRRKLEGDLRSFP